MTQPRISGGATAPGLAIQDIVRRADLGDLIQRVVVTGTNAVELYIQRTGQSAPDAVSYPTLDGVSVIAGDEVILLRVGSGYIVIGKVVANRL